MIMRAAMTALASFSAVALASARGTFSMKNDSAKPPLARAPTCSAAAGSAVSSNNAISTAERSIIDLPLLVLCFSTQQE